MNIASAVRFGIMCAYFWQLPEDFTVITYTILPGEVLAVRGFDEQMQPLTVPFTQALGPEDDCLWTTYFPLRKCLVIAVDQDGIPIGNNWVAEKL